MKVRRFVVVIVAVVVVLLAGLAWFLLRQPQVEQQEAFSLNPVKRGNIVSTVSATGTLSPVITVQVGSQVSGTIQHLYADFNSRVQKGELIAQIDPALFKARLAEAEANFKSAEATRDKAWIAVLDAKRQLDRLQKQQKQKLVSDSDVDAARFAYDAAVVACRASG